jgi:hypothetical protein
MITATREDHEAFAKGSPACASFAKFLEESGQVEIIDEKEDEEKSA